jgi:antitoxin component YwqK of YwqJK toxin-antitoxin module
MKRQITYRLFIASFIVLIIACSGKKVDVSSLQLRQDKYYVINEGQPFSGTVIQLYEGSFNPESETHSQIKTEYRLAGGVMDGKYISYFQNGQKQQEGSYKEGAQNGKFHYWHQNGTLNYEVDFEKGKWHGKKTTFFQSGKVSTLEFYKEGKLQGSKKSYDESENLSAEYLYEAGVLTGPFKTIAGEVITSEGHYIEGKLDGEVINRYDNGTVGQKVVYTIGKLVSILISKDENGNDKPFRFNSGKGVFRPFGETQSALYVDGARTRFPIYGTFVYACAFWHTYGLEISKTGGVSLQWDHGKRNPNYSFSNVQEGNNGSVKISSNQPFGGAAFQIKIPSGWDTQLINSGFYNFKYGFSWGLGCNMKLGRFSL